MFLIILCIASGNIGFSITGFCHNTANIKRYEIIAFAVYFMKKGWSQII